MKTKFATIMKRKDIAALQSIENMQERKAALRKILAKYDPFTDIVLPKVDEEIENKLNYFDSMFSTGMSIEYPDESKKYEDGVKFSEDHLPLSKVPTIDCYFNQKTVTIGRLVEILDGKLDSEEIRNGAPHDYARGSAVDGKHYVGDGNHRLMLAKLLNEIEFEGYFIPDTLHLIPGLIHPDDWFLQVTLTYPDGYTQTLRLLNVAYSHRKGIVNYLINKEFEKHKEMLHVDMWGELHSTVDVNLEIINPYNSA